MHATPRGMRLHIGLFGRRNAGKSSLLNTLAGQEMSIVSPTPGTTTDPVEKSMELQPIGPVVLVDTAGLDDQGELGQERVRRSMRALEKIDLVLLLATADAWGDVEASFLARLRAEERPVIVVFTQVDRTGPPSLPGIAVSAMTGQGMDDLRAAITSAVSTIDVEAPSLLADLVPEGRLAVLVMPIDKEAPKGRLILPQAQAVRDLLDHHAMSLVVQDRDLPQALAMLREPPALVVTDSQAFAQVDRATPPEIPLTSFSILFARQRGHLPSFARGARAIDSLRPGDRILVAESCCHHPIEDDIGRTKLPRWLEKHVAGPLEFEFVRGVDFPEDLSPFKLILHCGGCMGNRRSLLYRQGRAREAGVPMTNYGVAIGWLMGMAKRALSPFAEAWKAGFED